jgi:hypothetical protein
LIARAVHAADPRAFDHFNIERAGRRAIMRADGRPPRDEGRRVQGAGSTERAIPGRVMAANISRPPRQSQPREAAVTAASSAATSRSRREAYWPVLWLRVVDFKSPE